MSTYVLVHGAFHGAWCWDKIVPLLEGLGHRVVAIDLPGHGQDQTPLADVTLARYTEHVCSVLDQESEKVILVGHSMGGIVITQVGEYRPDKIESLVYLAAFLPQNGQSLVDVHGSEANQNAIPLPAIWSADQSYVELDPAGVKASFYEQCSASDMAEAVSKLGKQSSLPLATPVQLTDERYGRVPKVYLEAVNDRTISIECQRDMQSKTPCQQVITMYTDHSPFLSQPEELVAHLHGLSR